MSKPTVAQTPAMRKHPTSKHPLVEELDQYGPGLDHSTAALWITRAAAELDRLYALEAKRGPRAGRTGGGDTMTCTCSGHANEPNPCPACEKGIRLQELFEQGTLDRKLGEWVREQRSSYRPVRVVIEEFLESRLDGAIPCPEEEA